MMPPPAPTASGPAGDDDAGAERERTGRQPKREHADQQRAGGAIAGAFLPRPRLIVADEPVSMIDASIRSTILELILELRERAGISFPTSAGRQHAQLPCWAMRSRAGIVMAVVSAVAAVAAQSPGAADAQQAGQGVPTTPPAAALPPQPEQFRVVAPSRARGATVARIVAPTFARLQIASPKPGWRISTETAWSGQAQTLLVLAAATRRGRDWVKLLLANRPNGAAGWVPRDRVALGRSRYWIDVRTAARRVTVYRNGRRVWRARAVVGTSGTPTPLGLAAIYEVNRQPDPRAFLGPWVLSLTVHSNVLRSFGGGPGRVGIHGRAGASLADPLGSARSHGCIRIDNRQIAWMAAHVPPGTPVRLRP